jgi:hypothetical protein
MPCIVLSKIEEFLSIAKDCKRLSIYEYYNGLECTIDSKQYLLTYPGQYDIYDENEFYMKIIYSSLHLFENINYLSCTSRFSGETNYSHLKITSPNLKNLHLSHLNGVECLNSIEDLSIDRFCNDDHFDIIKNCTTLKNLYIKNLIISNEKYSDFLAYLTNNNIQHKFDNISYT